MKKRTTKRPNKTKRFVVYLELGGYFRVKAKNAETAERKILNKHLRRSDLRLEPRESAAWEDTQ